VLKDALRGVIGDTIGEPLHEYTDGRYTQISLDRLIVKAHNTVAGPLGDVPAMRRWLREVEMSLDEAGVPSDSAGGVPLKLPERVRWLVQKWQKSKAP
jgi:hypothetical protein